MSTLSLLKKSKELSSPDVEGKEYIDLAESICVNNVGDCEGRTCGGNSLTFGVILAVLDVFEIKDLLSQTEKIGQKVMVRFKEFQKHNSLIGDVRGV